MSKSKIFTAISNVMRDISGITKDGKVTGNNGYNYITADNVLSHAGQAMAEHGLVVIPSITKQDTKEVTYTSYDQKKTRYESQVDFIMKVSCSETDEIIEERWVGYGVNHQSPDKALYAAMTSGHKYFYLKLFAVAVDNTDSEHEQHDNQSEGKQKHKKNKPQPKQPPSKPVQQQKPAQPAQQKQSAPPAQPTPPAPKQTPQQTPITPREYIEMANPLTYGEVAFALTMTSKYENKGFAMDMINTYPNFAASWYKEDGTLKGEIKADKTLSLDSALPLFDWCVNNSGVNNETN